jgi:hypothetical protein
VEFRISGIPLSLTANIGELAENWKYLSKKSGILF